MNRNRKVAVLQLLGAALCLGIIWPTWLWADVEARNSPPQGDAVGMNAVRMLAGFTLMLSFFLVVAAVALTGVAITRLLRK